MDLNLMLDSNATLLIIGGLIAFFGLLLAIFGITRAFKGGNKVSDRIDQFVIPERQPLEIEEEKAQIIPREISGSLLSRTLIAWFRKLLKFLGRFTPVRMATDIEHKLTIAGHPGNMHAAEFVALRFVVLIGTFALAILINRDISNFNMINLLLGFMLLIVGLLFPTAWLNGQMRKRQDEITRGLPDALDMLSVCASAGLGFDQSLQKISGYWDTELGREFLQVTHEMEMGVPRGEALKNLSDRLDVDDLTSFIAILIQAERIGMGYADILHSQASQMRIQRQYRAREIANRLPGKMIIPVALFIFPAMLIVILGPAIPVLFSIF